MNPLRTCRMGPETVQYPVAEVLPSDDDMTTAVLESDTQSKTGSLYTLDGDVVIHYRDRIIKADHIEFDEDTGEMTANGHLHVTGGANHEDLTASHGSMNLKMQTATFYDVTGSVGLKSTGHAMVYASSNPFLFTGRMVVRTGPQSYEIYDGTLTTCQLPHPDWMLYSGKFAVDSEKAKAQNSVFRLMNIPVLFLPYVTHPVDSTERQSGILIPAISYSSSKGFILGEQYYWAINRSTDVTVGAQYYSLAWMGAVGELSISRRGERLREGKVQRAAGPRHHLERRLPESRRRGRNLLRQTRLQSADACSSGCGVPELVCLSPGICRELQPCCVQRYRLDPLRSA